MSHTLVSTTRPSRSPGRITCEVLGFKVQVVKLVDVADIHLFLVQLRLIKVLGGKSASVESCSNTCLLLC